MTASNESRPWWSDAAIAVGSTAMVLALSSLLNYWPLVWRSVALLALCVSLSALISAWFALGFAKRQIGETVEETGIGLVRASAVRDFAGRDIISAEDLARAEALVRCPEIWIVAWSVALDVSNRGGGFRDVIARNLVERRISYVYFVPESVGPASVDALRAAFGGERLSVIPVSVEKWNQLSYRDGNVVIYNPRSATGFEPLVGWMELPSGQDPPDFVRLRSDILLRWVDELALLLDKAV